MRVDNVAPTGEVGKYLKRKESNTSNAKKKSKHKHEYCECLLINIGKERFSNHKVFLGSYCRICGKVDNWTIVWDDEIHGPYKSFKSVSDEEVLRRYSHVPKFEVDDIYKVNNVDIE